MKLLWFFFHRCRWCGKLHFFTNVTYCSVACETMLKERNARLKDKHRYDVV